MDEWTDRDGKKGQLFWTWMHSNRTWEPCTQISTKRIIYLAMWCACRVHHLCGKVKYMCIVAPKKKGRRVLKGAMARVPGYERDRQTAMKIKISSWQSGSLCS
jgi:hypothetical protein